MTQTTETGFPCGIKPELQLVGEDGNSFSILARARTAARRAGVPAEEIDQLLKYATEGDYNHLLCAMMEYFDEPESDEDDSYCDGCGYSDYNCECDDDWDDD